jgi:sarcosine oxidase subunit gamma
MSDGGVRVQILEDLCHTNLRGVAQDELFLKRAESHLGQAIPIEPNCFTEGRYRIYWLGPDEWLVVTPAARQEQVKADLLAALDGVFCSVVDNSSGLTMLHISGDNAAALLATDCPFDLHPQEFKTGQCAQTRLARAGMTISPLADGAGFEIIIRRSFADYLLLWLQDAAIAFE